MSVGADGGGGTPRVTVYVHAACHLCELALERLGELAPAWGFAVEAVDIHSDERLLRAYFERVPVVAVDGEEVCELHLDETALAGRLGRGPAERQAGSTRVRFVVRTPNGAR